MVKFQQPSEPFPAEDRPVARERIGVVLREQEQVFLALMWPLVKVMMLDIFGDGMPERDFDSGRAHDHSSPGGRKPKEIFWGKVGANEPPETVQAAVGSQFGFSS